MRTCRSIGAIRLGRVLASFMRAHCRERYRSSHLGAYHQTDGWLPSHAESMKIVTIGRGNIGGGLADLWERAGHQVTRLGREGGDVSDADVVLMAMPGGAIAEAIAKLTGIDGRTVIDATNLYGVVPPAGFASNAEFVKSKTNGPTAKSFNVNFASLYPRFAEARARPSNLWCGDAETREVVGKPQPGRRIRPCLCRPDRERRATGGYGQDRLRYLRRHWPIRLPHGATRAALTRVRP